MDNIASCYELTVQHVYCITMIVLCRAMLVYSVQFSPKKVWRIMWIWILLLTRMWQQNVCPINEFVFNLLCMPFSWNWNFRNIGFIPISSLKGTVSVTSSGHPCKIGNVRFTTVSLKALSDQVWKRYHCFYFFKSVHFICGFSGKVTCALFA